MATQTYNIADMQQLNSGAMQVQQAPQNNNQAAVVTVSAGQMSKSISQNNNHGTTIIQPSHGGQQFIVTIAEPPNEQVTEIQGGNNQVVYNPAQTQYVDESNNPIFATSRGQMQSYTDYSQNNMYTPVSGTYYQTSSGGQVTMGALGSIQGQLLTHQGNTYIVQGGSVEDNQINHTSRASPANNAGFTRPVVNVQNYQNYLQDEKLPVQWLIDNYETAEGVSLPRSTLYNHYMRHCAEQKMDPMNPASFGKLIRSVFLGLRTRRLGTRGNSKYHYYGIRIKASSSLNQFSDDQTMAMRQQPANTGKRFKTVGRETEGDGTMTNHSGDHNVQQHQHQQFLGDASGAIPNFESIEIEEGETLPEGITLDHLQVFEQMYREHCEAILDVVVNLQFSLIESLWRSFWRNCNDDAQNGEDVKLEQHFPKHVLYLLCQFDPVVQFVRQSDYLFYQALVEVLIPDVLRPIPSSLTQAIRNFAKSLENWLKNSMNGIPQDMVRAKVGAVSAFAQTLRRYTSLNHLAQAARAVLQNTSQINQMLTDLNRVDFANVQEQASWVCQCDDSVVHQIEQDFKQTLQQHTSLENWANWLESVVNQVLKQHEGSANFPKAARQFLLKWSFYSSMVIRDLTLRSAASFGSFHLIRLLYDEYMFYLVEHKVASATDETPIAVMGDFIDFGHMASLNNYNDLNKIDIQASTKTEPSPCSINTTSASDTINDLANIGTNSSIVSTVSDLLLNHASGMPSMSLTNGTALSPGALTSLPNTNSIMSSANISTPGNFISVNPSINTTSQIININNSVTHLTQNNNNNITQRYTNIPRVTVNSTNNTSTKTIVVVPVSASNSDEPLMKKIKVL